MPSLRGEGGQGEGQGGRTHLTAACAPIYTAFETSRNNKTTDNDGKRINYV